MGIRGDRTVSRVNLPVVSHGTELTYPADRRSTVRLGTDPRATGCTGTHPARHRRAGGLYHPATGRGR